ncbi:general transcription factor IIH subunit 3 [Adelges cooleyi]|uniref:general transcription factor IIH subunit 3 n=1 Tax=Adelges cooleyi TaxID=133065 RepID=UPI002180671F|nr:general transcription factor IIH subunit 3 [Adelges cooleyi]
MQSEKPKKFVSSLLVIILDVNPAQDILLNGEIKLSSILSSVVAFANSHLMLRTHNKVAVLASDPNSCDFIYSDQDELDFKKKTISSCKMGGSQYELFSHIDRSIKFNIMKFLRDAAEEPHMSRDTVFGASCAKSLCYINRLQNNLLPGEIMNSRILIISGCDNEGDKYIRCMNTFFTAQKQNVAIDACSLTHDVTLLKQACYITEGSYFRMPKLEGLLLYLQWIFLTEPSSRKKLVIPLAPQLDFRPFCFCHGNLTAIGFVCSLCLTIYCKISPICTTCEAVFKVRSTLAVKPKKKKTKVSSATTN